MRGYSTGMKQRVKLAQALVHDPRLLLLDEPTNGLDPEGRDEMLDLVRRTGTEFGISIVMASHLLSEIERVCDHLVVIDAGKLVQSDAISAFTERTAMLAVEVDGDAAPLAERLRVGGYNAESSGRDLRVDLAGDTVFDAIRDGAVDLGLGLVRLEQGRRQLEDLFKDVEDGVEAAGV
jgi:ABC-2 type transport system ATP-binding protein